MLENTQTISLNRKARHDYFIEEVYEAGMELHGTEVKSIRLGKVNLKDSFCSIDSREIYVIGMHISPYEKGNIFNKDPLRKRRLLMHKKEILKLEMSVNRDRYTLVPLSLYFKGSKIKISIGLCKGKKLYDKRLDIAKRDAKRVVERAVKCGIRNI